MSHLSYTTILFWRVWTRRLMNYVIIIKEWIQRCMKNPQALSDLKLQSDRQTDSLFPCKQI